jgi:small redox-active disulfide protein 2
MSISVKILGTGCAKCKTTTALVEQVIKENNIDVTLEKVEDIMDIMMYNVMSTPAIVINETVVIKGRVPNYDEIKSLLTNNEPCCEPKDNTDSCCGSDTTETSCC